MICLKRGHIECQKCANTLSGLMTVTRKIKRRGYVYMCWLHDIMLHCFTDHFKRDWVRLPFTTELICLTVIQSQRCCLTVC